MSQNMYRVGDFVYFEASSAAPYQVRRIEELNKTPSGNVEARVLCFYRRRDVPNSLLKVADRAERMDKVVNSRRRLVLAPQSAVDDESSGESSNATKTNNGDEKTENGSEAKQSSSADLNEVAREISDSPKPMQVDISEEDECAEDNGKDSKECVQKKDEVEACEYGLAGLPKGAENLALNERHMLRQHELFLTRQVETLPATHIRGKCTVTLLSDVETPEMYMDSDDSFFYSLVFDPTAMTLLADKGEIRVGEKYQCVVPDSMEPDAETEDNKENGNLVIADEENDSEGATIETTEREVLVYHCHHNLSDRDIDQFLIVARAVGTFSRALDTSSAIKLPSLHMTAAAASRDVTLFHAMALLHQANYDIGQAVKYLVPPPSKQHYPLDTDKSTSHNTVSLGGPILCRDQMEEWSAAEANLFEEAIEKYGKDFNDIRADYLPWKSLRDIVEYYYMWKTTNRYVEVKKSKAIEQESKLKQVYIPNYNKPNPNMVGPPNPSGQPLKGTSACESCKIEESTQWYAWGPAHLQLRLCCECWSQWKKYGGLKRSHDYESYDLDGVTNTADSSNQVQKANIVVNSLSKTSAAPNRNGASNRLANVQQSAPRIPSSQVGNVQQAQAQSVHHKLAGVATLPIGPKTRVAFYLNTTLSMRIARRLAPKSLFNIRRSARRPFLPINGHAIKQYCTTRQPIEIIRAARQIKASKLPDSILSQLAASIIASGTHLTVSAPSSTAPATVSPQKRPAQVSSDKNAPPSKRQPHQAQQLGHIPGSYQQYAVQHPAVNTTSQHTHNSPSTAVATTTSISTTTPTHHLSSIQQCPPSVVVTASGRVGSAVPGIVVPTKAARTQQLGHSLIGSQQQQLDHGVVGGVHEAKLMTADVGATSLGLPGAAIVVPPAIAAVNPAAALFASIQQQQQQQLQTVAARPANTLPTTLICADTLPPEIKSSVVKRRGPDSRWSGADDKLLFLAGARLKLLRRRICSKKRARKIALHPCRISELVNSQWPNLQGFFI